MSIMQGQHLVALVEGDLTRSQDDMRNVSQIKAQGL